MMDLSLNEHGQILMQPINNLTLMKFCSNLFDYNKNNLNLEIQVKNKRN